jgi:hypothetical protein
MATSRYKHPHHQRIERVLHALNPDVLTDCACYFGGGTAVALLLGEYRESVDIDFVCSNLGGFRRLRNLVTDTSLGDLLLSGEDLPRTRPVRRDQYGVRTWITVDETPIRIEFIQEGRIAVSGAMIPELPVPVLTRADLFAEKLLANADRWSDSSILYRDIIDLTAMANAWGPIPEAAWAKARQAYGASVDKAYEHAQAHVQAHPEALVEAFTRMHVGDDWQSVVREGLGIGLDHEQER